MKLSFSHFVLLLAVAAFTFSSCRNEANLIPETCFDGVQNQGETAVDCGGPNCPSCAPTCDDGQFNQDEFSPVTLTNPNVIGIDCGGENCPPCSTCDDGIRNAHWVLDPNITPSEINQDSIGVVINPNGQPIFFRLVMERGIDCGFPCDSVCPPSCLDGVLNGFETGIDCGGPDCPPCIIPPNCNDGIQNGMETGIDCGSAECPISQQGCPDPTCSDGIQNSHIEVTDIVQEGYLIVVEAGIDCDNNPLTSCPDCPLPTCFDGIQNGLESGIDCGGNCITACSELETCNDGIMNGNEQGIDCGGPDCPPCAWCDDEFKNGPELLIDCVDYPFPSHTTSPDNPECALCPCPLCPSCHDGELTQTLFELDIDCGGPTCEPCEQFLIANSIGNTVASGSQFLDQATFNALLALGNQDTLSVEDPLVMLPTNQNPVGNGPFRVIRGVQRINVPNTGTYERVLEIFIPAPANLEQGEITPLIPFPQGPAPGTNAPTIQYTEGFIDGEFEGLKTFRGAAPDPVFNDPLINSLNITYNYTNLAAGLIRGNINFMRVRETNVFPPNQPEFRVVSGITFAVQYIPQQ